MSCALWSYAGPSARAEPEPTAPEPLDRETHVFRYTSAERPNYARATLEEVGLLAIEFAHYVNDHDLNSQDWDFSYDWSGVRSKLSGRGLTFDTNGFNTNFVSHPLGGTFYYWAARGNRLGVFESFVYATVVSALWEYLGELRERASINDLVVTPVAGLALGEATVQLGLFFEHSCDTVPNRMLGALFGPVQSVHDALDAATPVREVACDRYGFSTRGEHVFRLSVASGALFAVAGPKLAPTRETRVELHTQLWAFSTYGAPGKGFTQFSDGNVSSLRVTGSFADSAWNDFTVRTAVMPLGVYYRDLTDRPNLRGYDVLFGMEIGAEYNQHRFGSNAPGALEQSDRHFALDAPGTRLGYRWFAGRTRLELALQASVALSGIDPFALRSYLADHAIATLTSVARAQGYDFAAGFRCRPSARIVADWFEAGADLDAMRVRVITGFDRHPEQASEVPGSEMWTVASAWLRAGRGDWPLRVTLLGSFLQRAGSLASAHVERSEFRLLGGIDAVL